jgi:hypothetical protein
MRLKNRLLKLESTKSVKVANNIEVVRINRDVAIWNDKSYNKDELFKMYPHLQDDNCIHIIRK